MPHLFHLLPTAHLRFVTVTAKLLLMPFLQADSEVSYCILKVGNKITLLTAYY